MLIIPLSISQKPKFWISVQVLKRLLSPLAFSNMLCFLLLCETKISKASYCFANVYFMDDMLESNHGGNFAQIPSYMHILQHVYRSTQYSRVGSHVKCFHDVNQVKTLHNHYPFSCMERCSAKNVAAEVGHLQHYRKECVGELAKVCAERYRNQSVLDTTVWKYKDELVVNTNKVLDRLGFF